MCSYNAANYVREQLDSFLRQTRLPDELVICDDASTDETRDIIGAFARSAPFEVRLYSEPSNIGRVANFQKAISHSNKEIIFLSDADDVWNEQKIWRMSQALQSTPDSAGVFCDAEIVDASLRPLGYSVSEARRFTPELQARLAAGDAHTFLLRSRTVQGAALAFWASHRPLLLPLSSRWGHDSWIAVLLAAAGRLVFVDEKLMSYRQHGQNLIGVARAARKKDWNAWTRRVREPKSYHQNALGVTTYLLLQLDDLEARITERVEPTRRERPLEAIAYRRLKLNRRKRAIELVLKLLNALPLQNNPAPQEIRPRREIGTHNTR
jgi:glycosyltransferase involved in cell wall biosynthesis